MIAVSDVAGSSGSLSLSLSLWLNFPVFLSPFIFHRLVEIFIADVAFWNCQMDIFIAFQAIMEQCHYYYYNTNNKIIIIMMDVQLYTCRQILLFVLFFMN